eukprot:TRINITY_DN43948_c0_g1_i1.p1 TRINITY_DN43948_c0_g1~~TRINITY_DN43948_c0_g1_i1.p1  ORF type:complete len:491 (-),score=80.43 TRINITY_DN43948_c0_g1_i1:277-1749(-)
MLNLICGRESLPSLQPVTVCRAAAAKDSPPPSRLHQPPGVVVLGGGAAGLLAAMTAGRRGRPVVVLERNADVGRKIKISGGGRCNFTNVSPNMEHGYHSSSSSSSSAVAPTGRDDSSRSKFFQRAFSRYPPEKFIALVESHGIKFHEKKLGQLFCSHSAHHIVDMLREECSVARVKIKTDSLVTGVEQVRQETSGVRYRVTYQKIQASDKQSREPGEVIGEETIDAEAIVVASGGLSFAKACGSTDLAHRIAESFGLEVHGVRPGLVPLLLSASEKWTSRLVGVSLEVKATIGSAPGFVENLLFTHKGVSGPAVLQASSFWGPGGISDGMPLQLDLLPRMDLKTLTEWLERKAQKGSERVERGRRPLPGSEDLCQKFPRRFAEAFWHCRAVPSLGVEPTAGLQDLSPELLSKLAQLLKGWEITIAGTEGYPKAEVTCGGVNTEELSDETMESFKHPGLYFIGEAVDVTGWLGGYNFQWAWASGHAAGSAC